MIFYNNIILVPVCVPPLNDYKPLKPFNRSVSKLGDVLTVRGSTLPHQSFGTLGAVHTLTKIPHENVPKSHVITCDNTCTHTCSHVITCDFGTCSCGIFVRALRLI